MPFSVQVDSTDETAPLVSTDYGSSSSSSKSSKTNKTLSYCCIFGCVSLLIIALSFVCGVMYANFSDTVPLFNNNPTHASKNYAKYAKSHLLYSNINNNNNNNNNHINNHASGSNNTDNSVSYECSTYPYWEWSTEELEGDGNTANRMVYYWCYLTSDECDYCYEESEDTGVCSSDGKYDCVSRCDENNAEAAADNDLASGTELFCYAGEEDNSGCFSLDTIVTRLVKTNNNNNNNNELITEDIMVKDINLGDYLLSGLNGEFSKVIDKTHYTPYEGSLEPTLMRQLCFDHDINDLDIDINNCIKLTGRHLIYVNGIDLDSIKPAKDIVIGDYLYHTGLNKMVKITSIKDVLEYYRGFVTENGNIIVNNGFYSSTVSGSISYDNPKNIHLAQVYVLNMFYKLFTFNGIYDGLWNNYYFDQILKLPAKSAILQWIGMKGLYRETEEYKYPLEYTICLQSVGFILIYLIYQGFNGVSNFNRSVNHKVKQC